MAIQFDSNGTPMVKYNDTQGWYDAWNKYRSVTNRWDNKADEQSAQELTRYGDTFAGQFRNLVGRDPDQNEFNQFWNNVVIPQGQFSGGSAPGMQELSDQTGSFINNNFQKAMEEQAGKDLQAQQGQANQLSDLFRSQGNEAIQGYQSSLLDFTQKLIERARPNLMTSLQAQGLLNTGGLNLAIAGQQADLANDAAGQVADLQFQNDQAANAIRFGGASAPYEYQQAAINGRSPYMQAQGQGALERMFQSRSQNLDALNRAWLMDKQAALNEDSIPSLTQMFKRNASQAAGTAVGQDASPTTGIGKMGGGSSVAGGAAMMSSKTFKKDISKMTAKDEDELYDRFINMPLSRWKYKTEADSQNPHLGVVTEEAIPEIVLEDGKHLSTVDYFGVMTLAIKVMHRRLLEQKAA